MAADVATGATLSFTTEVFVTLTSIRWSGLARKVIPTSHLATTSADTFMPGDRYDPGELQVEGQWQPDQSTGVIGALTAAITTGNVTFPAPAGRTSGAKLAGSLFLTNLDIDATDETLMTFSGTLKWSGTIALTTSA